MERDVKQLIIDTVKKLYMDYDYEAISLSMILKEAGISKGAIYWYYPSKEAIFEEIFRECAEEMLCFARCGICADDEPLMQLCQRQKNMLRYTLDHPIEQNFVQKYEEFLSRNRRNTSFSYISCVEEDTQAIIEAGKEKGQINDLPTDFLVRYCVVKSSMLNAYLMTHPDVFEDTALFNRMIDLTLEPLRA